MSDDEQHERNVEAVTSLAAEAAWKGATALVGPAGLLVELGRMLPSLFLSTGTQRLQNAVQEEIVDAALRRLPEVERHVRELRDRDVNVSAGDFKNVLFDFAKATAGCRDEKKRKLLEDAFVNSFSQDLYESGELTALWDALDRLTYGDLRMLGKVAAWKSKEQQEEWLPVMTEPGTMNAKHWERINAEQLVFIRQLKSDSRIELTELGRWLMALVSPPSTPPAQR